MAKYYTEIKWALIYIVVSLLWMLFEKLVGLHSTHIDKQQYLTLGFLIPAIWVYVLALQDKKKKDYRGRMTYLQGFVSGLIISVIVTLFSPLTQWIITYVITPEYFPNVIEYSLKTGYHKSRAEAEAYFNFNNYAKQSTIASMGMGVGFSLIIAFFVKSKR